VDRSWLLTWPFVIRYARTLLGILLFSMFLAPVASSAQTCLAGNVNTFANCVAEANRGQVNRIEVTALIVCDGPTGCEFGLHGIDHALAVVGTNPAGGAGFRRTVGAQSHYGLRIADSSGPLTISDLVFDEGPNIPVGAPGEVWSNAACYTSEGCHGAALAIDRSAHIIVERTTFADSKFIAVTIAGSTDVTIRQARFLRSWLHGVWLSASALSSGIRVQGSEFVDVRSNAIMFSGSAPNAASGCGYNLIVGNLFRHNHRATHYHACGSDGHQPCGGGQIDIEQHSDHVLIAGNRIVDGRIDEDPSLRGQHGVTGIEVAVSDIRNVVIAGNEFLDLSGPAIVLDRPGGNVAPIAVIGNRYGDNISHPIADGATPPGGSEREFVRHLERCTADLLSCAPPNLLHCPR
jgi:hypothetical protein